MYGPKISGVGCWEKFHKLARKYGAASRKKKFIWLRGWKIQLGRSLPYFDNLKVREWRIWITYFGTYRRKIWILNLKCSRMKVLLNPFLRISCRKVWTDHFQTSLPWLKKIFDFADLKCPQNEGFGQLISENFPFSLSGMLQNEKFGLHISE